ncbi:MAG: alpha/beta hydrolase [Caldilineaceae bacterium]|nr:alpha/beta hydrolase [Caldilineaceae bacterium]
MSFLRIEGLLAPHAGQPVHYVGMPLGRATAAMVMIHGRGSSAGDILGLADEFPTDNFVYLAPQAAGHTWYPNRFMTPIEGNEPYLSSALALIDSIVNKVIEAGIGSERIFLLGFSQGACLALEYAARHAGQYGGVIGLSGGLIGPPGTSWAYDGDFAGTPIFLGCSDVDSHIPLGRVEETAAVFERMGAAVTKRIYPGMGHTINRDEIDFIRNLLKTE